jgi:hypothetical protein
MTESEYPSEDEEAASGRQNTLESFSPEDYTTAVCECLPDRFGKHDRRDWEDLIGERVSVVIHQDSDYEDLLDDSAIESISLASLTWVVGSRFCIVFTGDGNNNSYDVTTLHSSHTNIDSAVEAACGTL